MKASSLDNILSGEDTAALKELKVSLKELLGDRLVKFMLYGSRARGDYEAESDIDVAIIVKGLTRELKNHILDIVAKIEIEYLTALSTMVISEEDFDLLKKRERRVALDIEREGISL
ncbi:MAG: nucleotidyltransferase domain-containing protein [Nitrospirota bacterium]